MDYKAKNSMKKRENSVLRSETFHLTGAFLQSNIQLVNLNLMERTAETKNVLKATAQVASV